MIQDDTHSTSYVQRPYPWWSCIHYSAPCMQHAIIPSVTPFANSYTLYSHPDSNPLALSNILTPGINNSKPALTQVHNWSPRPTRNKHFPPFHPSVSGSPSDPRVSIPGPPPGSPHPPMEKEEKQYPTTSQLKKPHQV